jgi:hypothetical protein
MVKDELDARELLVDLNSLIALTIRLDGHLRERRSEKRSGLGHTHSSTVARRNPKAVFFLETIQSHPSSLENRRQRMSLILPFWEMSRWILER